MTFLILRNAKGGSVQAVTSGFIGIYESMTYCMLVKRVHRRMFKHFYFFFRVSANPTASLIQDFKSVDF
jgi:hypothetical protein